MKEVNTGYKDNLLLDYTFEYPKIHDNVCALHDENQKQEMSFFFLYQIRAECLATRYRAALFNMSYFGKFWLKGPDAQVVLV